MVSWHADEGVSGGKAVDARPGLTIALDAVESASAAVLMVAKSDRLARSLPTLLHVIVVFHIPAASMMRSATSLGLDTIDRWLASSSIVLAFIRLAMNRSRSGLMVRSFLETA